MSTITPAEAAGRELGSVFEGELIGPGDEGYDEARTQFNATRPAVDQAEAAAMLGWLSA